LAVSSWFRANPEGAPAYAPDPPAWPLVALVLAGSLLVQSTLEPLLPIRGSIVSWVLLLVLWYAIRTGTGGGFVLGLIAGACEDALAGNTGAAWTFSTALVGAAAGRLARTWLADTKVALVPGVALATLVRFALFSASMAAEGRMLTLAQAHFHAALWQALLNALVALALLAAFPQLGRYGAPHR
jgi:rod shape-determining protein MreD